MSPCQDQGGAVAVAARHHLLAPPPPHAQHPTCSGGISWLLDLPELDGDDAAADNKDEAISRCLAGLVDGPAGSSSSWAGTPKQVVPVMLMGSGQGLTPHDQQFQWPGQDAADLFDDDDLLHDFQLRDSSNNMKMLQAQDAAPPRLAAPVANNHGARSGGAGRVLCPVPCCSLAPGRELQDACMLPESHWGQHNSMYAYDASPAPPRPGAGCDEWQVVPPPPAARFAPGGAAAGAAAGAGAGGVLSPFSNTWQPTPIYDAYTPGSKQGVMMHHYDAAASGSAAASPYQPQQPVDYSNFSTTAPYNSGLNGMQHQLLQQGLFTAGSVSSGFSTSTAAAWGGPAANTMMAAYDVPPALRPPALSAAPPAAQSAAAPLLSAESATSAVLAAAGGSFSRTAAPTGDNHSGTQHAATGSASAGRAHSTTSAFGAAAAPAPAPAPAPARAPAAPLGFYYLLPYMAPAAAAAVSGRKSSEQLLLQQQPPQQRPQSARKSGAGAVASAGGVGGGNIRALPPVKPLMKRGGGGQHKARPPSAARAKAEEDAIRARLMGGGSQPEVGAKLELLAQRQTVLKAAVDSLQDGNTKLRAKLAPLQSEVGVMMANNKQLRDNNSEMRAQIEALTQKLKAAGLIA